MCTTEELNVTEHSFDESYEIFPIDMNFDRDRTIAIRSIVHVQKSQALEMS